MSFSLLLPSALAALAALLLPLVIHLSRRSEQRVTDFAALRWLSIKLRPRRKFIFQEIPLLLLRLFMLIVLALFLAQPASLQTPAAKHWVLVTPGADIDAVKKLSLEKNSQWHWLAPGFPDYAEPIKSSSIPFSSLLRELDATLPENTKLTVIVPETLSELDGERLRLSRSIAWKNVPGNMPKPATENLRPILFAIRFDRAHADSLVYFQATYAAWQLDSSKKTALDIADTAIALPPDRNTLLWLASGELPTRVRDWVSKGNTLLVVKDTIVADIESGVPVWRNSHGQVLMQAAAVGQGRVLQWQQLLQPATMPELLEAEFPSQLQSRLQALPMPRSQAYAATQTPIHANIVWSKTPQSLQSWLAILIALLFLLERWLAYSAKRWSVA